MHQAPESTSSSPAGSAGSIEKTCQCCGRIYRSERDLFDNTSRWRRCSQQNFWFMCSCGSTLVILKDQLKDFNPSKSMSSKAASVFEQLTGKKELPYLSTAVMEFQSLLNSGGESPSKLATSLKRDPVLAAEILEIANNLKVPTGQKIKSLEHAIVYVGYRTVSEIVLVAGTKMLKFHTKHFTPEVFWNEGFLAGAIAESLGIRLKISQNLDELYLCATLANIGKIVCAVCFPAETDEIYTATTSSETPVTWNQAESTKKGIDHKILGEVAAVIWGFPVSIIDTARDHHRLPLLGQGEKMPTFVEISSLANQLSHKLLQHESRIEKDVFSGYFYRFFRDRKELNDFLKEVESANAHLLP